jgi:hypothetical protein
MAVNELPFLWKMAQKSRGIGGAMHPWPLGGSSFITNTRGNQVFTPWQSKACPGVTGSIIVEFLRLLRVRFDLVKVVDFSLDGEIEPPALIDPRLPDASSLVKFLDTEGWVIPVPEEEVSLLVKLPPNLRRGFRVAP